MCSQLDVQTDPKRRKASILINKITTNVVEWSQRLFRTRNTCVETLDLRIQLLSNLIAFGQSKCYINLQIRYYIIKFT